MAKKEKMKKDEVLENGLTYGDIHVEWMGMDGLLVALYLTLATIYGWGVINRVDWIVGIMAPVNCIIITWGVFFRYCKEVYGFMKK